MSKERVLIVRSRLLKDRAAFTTLIAMHQGKVRAFLMRLTRDYDQTNDLAQETFIAAYSKLAQFRGNGTFASWLFQIAYNKFLESRRGAARRSKVHESFAAESRIEDSIYESISPEQLDLETALMQLTPEQAAALSLCYSYGCSHSEAAKVLDTPVGTLKTNIRRGKQQLLRMLQDKEMRSVSNE